MSSKQPNPSNTDKTTWKESPFLMMKGFLMGAADIVPGVSGGTMALITGIYDRLIHAIKSVDGSLLKSLFLFRFKEVFARLHWQFLLLLFSGIVLAVVFFTRVVPLQEYMFTHPEIVYGLFFGLIVGSIALLIAEIDSSDRNWKNVFPLLFGALLGFWVVTLVPTDTPESFWFVFLSGSVAICAMILPGISGSYLLLIFRKYDFILEQLGNIGDAATAEALLNLLPFVLGAITGLALFSRLLSWLLKSYYSRTLLVLIGFLIGSLYVIWPFQERKYQESVRDVQVMPVTDPVVLELMARDTVPNKPRYQRIGRELSSEAAIEQYRRVEVETVSKKMISSRPFIPGGDGQPENQEVDVTGGVLGMGIGVLMIAGIFYLRKKR